MEDRKAKGTPPARAPALLASASQPSPPGHGGWRSWQRSCHCRGSIWCALVGVWHRTRRAILVPTARQQGVDGDEASSGAARWNCAQLHQQVFPSPWNRACVSTRDATPHRRHHPWTGDPEDPAPSATLCRPISHHPRVCLPSHRRGGLSLRPAASGRACGWGGVPWCVLSERRWPALMASRASAGAIADPAPGAHGASHACRLQVDTEENMQNSYPLCGVSTRWWSCVRSSCRVRRKIGLPIGSGSSPVWGRKRQQGTSGVPFERGRRPYACHLAEQPQP